MAYETKSKKVKYETLYKKPLYEVWYNEGLEKKDRMIFSDKKQALEMYHKLKKGHQSASIQEINQPYFIDR